MGASSGLKIISSVSRRGQFPFMFWEEQVHLSVIVTFLSTGSLTMRSAFYLHCRWQFDAQACVSLKLSRDHSREGLVAFPLPNCTKPNQDDLECKTLEKRISDHRILTVYKQCTSVVIHISVLLQNYHCGSP